MATKKPKQKFRKKPSTSLKKRVVSKKKSSFKKVAKKTPLKKKSVRVLPLRKLSKKGTRESKK
jgi:hypothetical protein